MNDGAFMREAYKEAWKSAGHTRPNPPVGAVIVKDGQIVGRGRHRRCGGDHAEVAAIKDACRRLSAKGTRPLAGCTLYCTLEPCSRPGRVGACTEAILAAGLSRIVWSAVDPNPVNRGKAARIFNRHGVACGRLPLAADEARLSSLARTPASLLAPFAKHVTTGLPFVTVKLAMSLDGKICDDFGRSQWISSAASRRTTGRLREIVDCVMVGAETVRQDDPSLLCHTKRNDDLLRAVVSASGRLPKRARIFADEAKARTHVFRSPREALVELGRMGVLHVLCEGGLGLARALAAEGLVDEWITVLSPLVIGNRPMAKALRLSGTDRISTSLLP